MKVENVKPRHDHWLPRLLRVRAITLFPYIFFRDRRQYVSASTGAHELIHIKQVVREGYFAFYLRYIFEFIHKIVTTFSFTQAMEATHFEREAYDSQRDTKTQQEAKDLGLWG